MLVKWNEKMRIGIEFMDKEHKELLQEVQDVLESVDFLIPSEEDIDKYLVLEAMILKHFDHEELLMRQYHYPKIDEHIDNHNKILEKIERFKALFYTTGLNEKQLSHIESEVNYSFKAHMLEEDKELEEFVIGKMQSNL